MDFVILKIHPQWLRQAQPPILLLHDAWASRRQHQKNLITSSPHHQEKFHTQWLRQAQPPILPLHGAWACRRQHQKNLITSSPHHQEKFHTQWLRQAQPPILLLHGAWACRRHHLFYCIKIRALYRTSTMLLWELNNGIVSTTLREPCDIKANTKIPPTVASTSSATNYFITRCLSLSKAHYFYFIKIGALYRTSPMLLWELKNAIISQNLRELCDIKNL